MAYIKNTTWVHGAAPGIDAAALNNLETQYDEAVTTMHAIAYDYAPVRSLNTVYQNTTGKPLLVTVNMTFEGNEFVQCLQGSANPPTSDTGALGCNSITQAVMSHTFIVPINYYYKVLVVTGTPTINRWVEYTLH